MKTLYFIDDIPWQSIDYKGKRLFWFQAPKGFRSSDPYSHVFFVIAGYAVENIFLEDNILKQNVELVDEIDRGPIEMILREKGAKGPINFWSE